MNIIYLHTHDSGRYLQPYGHAVPTPNLMALARESTLFRNAYCAGPTCSPSRAALLTGTWPHVAGMTGLAHRGGFRLRDYGMHMARYLKTQGYETALSGVQHEAADSLTIGYDRLLKDTWGKNMESLGDAESADVHTAELAAAYLRKKARSGGNFFLSVGLFATHRPFPDAARGAENVEAAYCLPPFPLYDCDVNRRDMAGFHKSAAIADRCAGIVLDAVRETGLDANTVILFTTDHGIAFPHMKCNLYDAGIGVALMIRFPGNPTAGTASDALVSQIDVFPTLCDLCGLPRPDWLAGTSLAPLLRGEAREVNARIYAEVTYHAAYEPMRCVRTDRYKLIRRYDAHLGVVPANIDNGESKRLLLDAGILRRPVAREMLFDLLLDPVERENLVGDAAYLEIYNDLSGQLSRWMAETHDPLVGVLHRVPAPEGANVNRLECVHPETEEWE